MPADLGERSAQVGDAGLFSIDIDDLLERAAPFGVDPARCPRTVDDAPMTLPSSAEALGDGMQLVPTRLGNPDARLARHRVPRSELGPTVVQLDVVG